MRTKEQDTDRFAAVKPSRLVCLGDDREPRVQRVAGGKVELAQSIEIKAVVDVASVRTATPLRYQMLGTKPAEVV